MFEFVAHEPVAADFLLGSNSVALQLPIVEFVMLKLSVCPDVPLSDKEAFCPGARFPVVGTCTAGPVCPGAGTVKLAVKSETLLTESPTFPVAPPWGAM